LIANAEQLISIISNTFGASAYVQTISNVIDKVGQQQIYDGLSSTINTLEIVILTCVTLLVSLIVVLISSLLINNSKRMGAVLKALGYSDASVLSSFLSIYVPTILLGLLIAIPISILMVFGFVNIIFGIGGILLISSTH
jgi:putative ABC transport system permease protein